MFHSNVQLFSSLVIKYHKHLLVSASNSNDLHINSKWKMTLRITLSWFLLLYFYFIYCRRAHLKWMEMLCRLENKPPMPYRVWTAKLSTVVRQWYKALADCGRDLTKVTAGVLCVGHLCGNESDVDASHDISFSVDIYWSHSGQQAVASCQIVQWVLYLLC